MRSTLIEVEGEQVGHSLYSMDWLRDRVKWHLDNSGVTTAVLLAIDENSLIVGHTIVRKEIEENGEVSGLISTTYVLPEFRRHGIAEKLLFSGENWMKQNKLDIAATWTSSSNNKLIKLYEKHSYCQVAKGLHSTTGTLMVKLLRNL